MSFDLEVNDHIITIDADERVGGENRGPRPKALLLAGLAGCTGMDVVSILKKGDSTDPANYRIFSCLDSGCHPRDKMDDKHDGKTGYVYDSVVCYSCHPDGKKPPEARYRLGPNRG